MQRAGTLFRSLLVRRTVRWRMTLLYGALFLLSGAILLAISGGVAVRSSTREVQREAAAAGPAGAQSALAQANGKIRQLQGQLAAAQHAHSASVTHQLVVGALIALAVMAAVSALLGWLMAGHALRPLRTMIATTRRISEDNLHERLAFVGPEDELKQLADTIDDLLERLESAFAAQRRFVANASHELRTPLATMRASLDVALAKPDPVPAQTAALATRLRTELDRIDDLLEGFLVLARARHGALPDGGTCDLGGLASAALAAYAAAATAKDLTVRAAVAAGARVAGSPALISRMIGNLIGNAIGHNEQAGWIAVTTGVHGGTVRLAVENGGRLLDPDQVRQLGQPFRRLGADRTGSDTGSGLGLSIVAAIAAAHGGSLELTARAEGGMRAEVILPLAIMPAAPGAAVLAGVRA
jgi:signal transduction histidine kinase